MGSGKHQRARPSDKEPARNLPKKRGIVKPSTVEHFRALSCRSPVVQWRVSLPHPIASMRVSAQALLTELLTWPPWPLLALNSIDYKGKGTWAPLDRSHQSAGAVAPPALPGTPESVCTMRTGPGESRHENEQDYKRSFERKQHRKSKVDHDRRTTVTHPHRSRNGSQCS